MEKEKENGRARALIPIGVFLVIFLGAGISCSQRSFRIRS